MSSERRSVLVTGSSTGLGFGVARLLAEAGYQVLVHGRNHRRAQDAAHQLRQRCRVGSFESVVADFSTLSAVRELAEMLNRNLDGLHAVVNNAGVATPNRSMGTRLTSQDGYLLEWQANFLVPFALSVLCSELLVRSAPARVINVSSVAQGWGQIHWSDPQLERSWDRMTAYAQSKVALTMFTNEYAARLAGTGVVANSLHPGMCNTRMVRSTFLIAPHRADYGSRNIARLVLDPDIGAATGQYFEKARAVKPNRLAADRNARRRLWDMALQQTRLTMNQPGVAAQLRGRAG